MSNSKYRVDECVLMLDCGRKYFTPGWIKRLIDEISAVGYNAINIHFAEDIAIRLESKTYPMSLHQLTQNALLIIPIYSLWPIPET